MSLSATESLLMSVCALASDALQDGASAEIKQRAATALRSVASMLDGGATAAATATSAPAAASSAAPAAASSSAPATQPDFLSTLIKNLEAVIPQAVPPEALAEAQEAARADGFKMPAGIDLNAFVASQAQTRN
jgi:hypothetical protein